MAKTRNRQLILQSQTWGGRREGAGRPKKKNSGQSHAKRPVVTSNVPVHITVRLAKGVSTLRSQKSFGFFREALRGAKAHGLRVLQFAVLGNHFHLIAEAPDTRTITRGMKSLNIRIARRLRPGGGAVLADRYDLRLLPTPKQVRNALVYVLTNAAKHFRRREVLDAYSSYWVFREVETLAKGQARAWNWRRPHVSAERQSSYDEILSVAESWLMRSGWKRAAV